MTSWAVVCDVYFLEPQAQQAGETAMQFAERVQALVAARAKLVVAPWDGCARAPSAAMLMLLLQPLAGMQPGCSPIHACHRQDAIAFVEV